ncbi:MAG: efflux RND transporter periplasmic adaptor subunit [Lentisphaeria bacterium]|nr:efflux RND transporter periplasmic adaptor subunit [Lentisphaeria bacterium]
MARTRSRGRPDRVRVLAAAAVVLAAGAVAAETIACRSFRYATETRGIVVAEEGMTITCPLNWPQITSVVPDGAYVEKGDVLTEFDREGIERGLAELRRREREVRNGLDLRLVQLANGDLDRRDQLAALRDDREVLCAQLERYRALPDPDDVAIASGRLHIARMEFEAAGKDYETARGRHARGMISPAELDQYEQTFREHEARLAYREGLLECASRPAREGLLRRLALRIANQDLDIQRTENLAEESERLSAIERQDAAANVESLERRIRERQDELERTVVRAPIAGFVSYLPLFRQQSERTGERMWKNFAYLRIPDQSTLVFRGQVPEAQRRYFREGDPVSVEVTARPGETVSGSIQSFGAMPHDRGEKEEEQSQRTSDSGIMVYDVTVKPDVIPDWLRVGMTAQMHLSARDSITGPSVPASFVRTRGGENYLAFDGVYQKVDGMLLEGFFVLMDASLTGRTVDWSGVFPENAPVSGVPGEGAVDNGGSRLRIPGEMIPADTLDVAVGRVYGWQKVSWLVAEDTHVQQGDEVARLDTADTDERIKERETELLRAENQLETEAEQLKRRNSENTFALSKARNLLAIARLDQAELLLDQTTPERVTAALNARLADIRVEFLRRRLTRTRAMREGTVSPLEIARLERDLQRAELQAEAARLRHGIATRGPEAAAVCRAEMQTLEQELEVSTLEKKLATDEARYNYGLRRAEREARRQRERLDDMKRYRENLVIKAPRAGLVRYSRVWNSGLWSKVAVGSSAGHHSVLMSVADVDRMFVRLEVPEKHFPRVGIGMTVGVRIPSLTDIELEGKVEEIEFLFQRRRKKDTQSGLYSSHEELGETVFFVRVGVAEQQGVPFKPGALAEVVFPFAK